MDIGVKYGMDTGCGRFDFSTTWAYLHKFQLQSSPGQPFTEYVGNNGFGTLPKYRSYTTASWQKGAYSVNLAHTFINSVQSFNDPTFHVGSYSSVDILGSVDAGKVFQGLHGLNVTVGINNLFNRFPPTDANDFSDPPADTGIYGSIGRFYYVNFAYRFYSNRSRSLLSQRAFAAAKALFCRDGNAFGRRMLCSGHLRIARRPPGPQRRAHETILVAAGRSRSAGSAHDGTGLADRLRCDLYSGAAVTSHGRFSPMNPKTVLLLLAGLGLFATTMSAQSTPPQPPPPPPEARQFDFWIGEWDVTAPNGKQVGTSRVERIAKGYGLLENWTGAGGADGKSLNSCNAARKQWQQFWVGNGGVLELAGGLVDGSMVMSGEHVVGGTPTIERITWTPLPDGIVRQHWEQSTDGGKTWTTAFDGRYHKKAG